MLGGSDACSYPLNEYLVDDENELLRWLADDCLTIPAHAFPLTLCGPIGSGKSRLAESIAGRLCRQENLSPKQVVMYSADEFRRSYINSINMNSVDEFRRDLADRRILIIDQLEKLKNSAKTQSELASLLDIFERPDRYLIMTSTVLPTVNNCFMSQLASRISAGLIIPVNYPGSSARQVLIRKIASQLQLQLSSEAISVIAERVTGSPQDLRQMLEAFSQASGQDLNQPAAPVDDKLINRFLNGTNQSESISVADIAKLVAKESEVTLKDLCGKTRRQLVVDARAIAMHLTRDLLGISYQKIGDYFGRRDHSTVRHSIQQVESRKTKDEAYVDWINQLRNKLDR